MTTDKSAPVMVTNPDPIPVAVQSSAIHDTSAMSTAKETAALAKADADILMSEGQRAINRLWERTQAIIAISIVEVTLAVVAILIVTPVIAGLFDKKVDQVTATAAVTGLVLLSNLVGNVTGSYFTRTNHSKVGGVVAQTPDDPRRGE